MDIARITIMVDLNLKKLSVVYFCFDSRYFNQVQNADMMEGTVVAKKYSRIFVACVIVIAQRLCLNTLTTLIFPLDDLLTHFRNTMKRFLELENIYLWLSVFLKMSGCRKLLMELFTLGSI